MTNCTFYKGEFFKSDVYNLIGKNISPNQLLGFLEAFTSVDFSNLDYASKKHLMNLKPTKSMEKGIYRIRVFEDCLRVRDFSVNNCTIERQGEDSLIIKFTNLGEERNHVILSDYMDVYICTKGYICLNVKGPVYYADGSRRYEGRKLEL